MARRKISIGFVTPRLEEKDDTIYVQLRQTQPNLCKDIFAEAVSSQDFKYVNCSSSGGKLEKSGKRADNNYGGYEMRPYGLFLSTLSELNDAEVTEERFKEDGLILTKILDSVKKSTRSLEMAANFLGHQL